MNIEKFKLLQNQIERNYPLRTLHILNGSCMLQFFRKNNLINTKNSYVPFNEAMCWGETVEKVFSQKFIKIRSHSLKSTPIEYNKIVITPLMPLFNEDFSVIALWFDDDMFCQMNLITILSYLDQINFNGKVLFIMLEKIKNESIPRIIEITPKGYSHIYKTVICNRKKCSEKIMSITQVAIDLYLNYRKENSPIIKYIKNNLHKKNLIEELLKHFSNYGFGDLQYEWIIEKINTENQN